MGNSFESQARGYNDESEIRQDRFGFKSAGNKYVNQNYKRIGSILGIKGEWLGNIKRQAKEENQLPDIQEQEELSLEKINFYRDHYDFPPLTQDELENIKSEKQPEPEVLPEPEIEGSEDKKLTRADFGDIPEDPYNIQNNDLEALNSLFDAKRDAFPNSQYVDIRNWAEWTPIEVVAPEKPNGKWLITKGVNHELVGDFDSETQANTEFDRIKNEDKQKALDLLKKARNFAVEEDLDTPWELEPEDSPDLIDSQPENQSIVEDVKLSEEKSNEAQSEGLDNTVEVAIEGQDSIDADTKDPISESVDVTQQESIEYTNFEALQQEFDRLIDESVKKENNKVTETVGKLARIEGREYDVEIDTETRLNTLELDILKEKAQEAINKYQEFHKSFRREYRTTAIQEQYSKLEEEAWSQIRSLINKLGGDIAVLPQERDIQLSHPEVVDVEKYLVDGGKIVLDAEGNITHLNINGNIIELNRPRTIDELLRSPRPTRILYHSGNPISEDDPTKQNYKGYWIKGLNPHTIQDIERELNDKQFLEPVIVDDTINPDVAINLGSDNYRGYLVINSEANQQEQARYISSLRDLEGNSLFGFTEDQLLAIFDNMGGVPRWDILAGSDFTPNIWQDLINNSENPNLYKIKTGIIDTLNPWLDSDGMESLGPVIRQPVQSHFSPAPDIEVSNDQQQEAFDIVEDPESAKLLEEIKPIDLVDRLAQLREQYAEAEEIYNRRRNDPEATKLFNDSRAEYNEALERMLKLKVAEGQEANIHQIFKDEVMSLRDSRIEQSQELQGKWEKRFNGAKEKFLGWATKHRKIWTGVNLGLIAVGAGVSLTGVGIPLAVQIDILRRSIGSAMSGVGVRNTLVGLMEDRDININKGFVKIKFQAVIPKIVRESISESEEQIKQVSDEVLKDRLGTLEAYYRLNGGKFTTDNQQKAYEKVLTELGHRVRRNTLEDYYKDQETSPNLGNDESIESNLDNQNEPNNQAEQDSQSSEIVHSAKFNFAEAGQSSRYASELLNTISDKRITELDKFRKNRKIATIAGLATTGILGGTLVNDMVKPGGVFNPNIDNVSPEPSTELNPSETGGSPSQISPDQTPSPGVTPEVTPPSAPEIPSTGAGEALSQATAEQAQELARDVSSLSSGETIWGEIAKQLGPNASPDQIQHALENYLESGVGQNTMFELAEKTEGGRALLSQWGIDNAGEMASLSPDQLYEISKHLGTGQLEGISNFNIDHLEAFQPAEYIDSATPDSVNTIPDTTNTPPVVETPIAPPAPEVPPVAANEFTSQLSEALGTSNLTETQLQEAIHSFATSEQGSVELYNQIISNEEGARFLSGFGVNNAADFANLRPDELYEIAQTVGVENLDKLPGFELNEIILSKFEDAPDMVELVRGTRPLDVVNRYIASEVGNLPYDSTLGQQVLNTYLDTTDGKQWLYDAIVNNPDVDNQNIQLFREYLRFKDIKSPEDFVAKFNWSEFSGNKNIPTAAFWNQTRLPNGGARLQPLSTFLKPSQMTGIKEAVRQVLTR